MHAKDKEAVQERLQPQDLDLLVMSWPSADEDGAQWLQMVREAAPGMPVLVLAPRSAEASIQAALDAGANDYIVKPVRRGELLTRIRVLLNRAYPERQTGERLRFGHCAFDTATGRLTVAGSAVDVTQKEFELALLFFRHLGRPLSRAYIREAVWSREPELPSRTIDTHVSRVRSKLGLRPENGFRLSPVYSYGYQLEQLS